MAKNVTGQVLGGVAKVFEGVDTVQHVFSKLELNGNYTATISGEPANMSTELQDYDFVSFSLAVKGGK